MNVVVRYARAGTAAVLGLWSTSVLAQQRPATQDEFALPPDVRVGELARLSELNRAAPGTTRNWNVNFSLEGQEILTDNAGTGPGRRADAITTISPGVLVNADTQRFTGNFYYQPTFEAYAFSAHQNTIAHQFGGSGRVSLIPDELFVDLQAFGTQQITGGGVASNGTVITNRADRFQTTSFAITPTARHRFDGIGTATAGYSFRYTNQGGGTALVPGTTTPFFVGNDLITNEEFAEFRTGENFGRLRDIVRADATQNSGQGVLNGSTENYFTNDVEYALNRRITALGQFGYENLRYSGQPPTRISDAIWRVGARLTPNPDSTITVSYGHYQGFNSPFVEAVYAVTARTRLFGSYVETLQTQQQALQNALAGTTFNTVGAPISTTTGAPVLLTNQFFGSQNALLRTKRANFTSVTNLSRDTVSFAIDYQRQQVVAQSQGTVGYGQSGVTGSLTWTHELSPLTAGSALVQYGVLTSPVAGFSTGQTSSGSQNIFTINLALSHSFSETLFGNVQYILSNGTNVGGGGVSTSSGIQNAVIFGLRKTFR